MPQQSRAERLYWSDPFVAPGLYLIGVSACILRGNDVAQLCVL